MPASPGSQNLFAVLFNLGSIVLDKQGDARFALRIYAPCGEYS